MSEMLRILNVEPDQYSDDARSILKMIGHLIEQNMERNESLKASPAWTFSLSACVIKWTRNLWTPHPH